MLTIIDPIPMDDVLLPMWTVYENPTDFPNKFVARLHITVKVGGVPTPAVTTAHMVSDLVSEIRNTMNIMGLTRLPRDPNDEPHIMETWI